ncbi:SusC/RagA family TonB-linked outer membrane protein [Dyadobacter beijingensis]|uniref:SusC/RagA family TonB-linked outer membrane protein n=1 Tax=Dyadobacter beijingensis TaxID=365489 RepID=A0ABQ2IJH6_9BACT|nr:TonB-dependent receptor [Dyadobacter beijingensis]GGN12120.1 SusC/RagA family TonB-linked outer membrane protein [Dyadobacter beijingensis]
MPKLLHIKVLVTLMLGCLLDVSPLKAQLMAQNRAKSTPNLPSAIPGSRLTLRDALMQVKKQFKVDILFEEKLLEGVFVAPAQIQGSQSLETKLNNILAPSGLRYKKVSKQTYLILTTTEEPKPGAQQSIPAPAEESPAIQQTITMAAPGSNAVLELHQKTADRTVTGVVKGDGGELLPGVSVLIKGTTRGSTTDVDGKYSITLGDDANATLVFSYVGYQNQEVAVGTRSTIDIALAPDLKSLEEVVVVGYGTQKREQITSAIASVKAEDFVKGPVQDAAQLIRGKVAGLSVITPSGDPTAIAQITLRGNATINASSEPLVLIDGVPGGLNTVAPEDIESIDVLKDGSAAAIYGTRGTNGVILITTRKVKGETPATLEVNSYFTTQRQTRKLDFMNVDQYRALAAQGKPGAIDYGHHTDWLKEVTQKPLSQVHNISLRGGSRSTNYIVSMEYRRLNGIMKKSDNTTVFPRIEVNHSMFNGLLKINANLSGYQQKYFSIDGGSYSGLVYRNALTFNPTEPLKDANGKWVERTDKTDYMNPVALVEESDGQNRNNNLRTYGTISLAPVEGLEIKALFARDMFNSTRGYYETKNHYSTSRNGRNGFASRGATRSQDDLFEFTANYNKSFHDHNFVLLAGHTWRKYNIENYWMQNWDFPTDNFSYNNINAGLALRRGQAPELSEQSENKLISYFFRVNYSFMNKYLLSASIRHEGSSRFGANHKWGSFPAFSVGWNLKREAFLDNSNTISNLKLRAGYGVTGTEPGKSYISLNKINFNTNVLVNGQWVQAINPSNNANPDLRWERKEELNVGIDYGFLHERLSGSIDLYRRTTRDLIADFPVPTPPYLYSTITANAASMENKGVEIQVNAIPLQTAAFRWSTSVNFSTNANKILTLSNDKFALASGYFDTGNTGEPIQQTTHRVQVGQPIGNFWGFKTIDIDETGHWIIEGKNGEPKPIAQQQADDKQIIGNGLPKRYLNWNNTLNYKNFDLNITMRGAFGFQILNMTEMFWSAPVMLTRGNLRSNAYDPIYGKRPLADDQSLNYVSYYIENGNYWKIDNITAGYNVRMKNKYLKHARIYLSVANLYTITGYKGIDPEVGISGLFPGIDDKNRYPATTSFTAGASITF